ncbi:hypothetical protein HK104_001866 [Borealophlyctis nickersoniae]|nr:hypothetical protein HK104_001866 [Borealophlyctis nickersoniae]
MGTTTGADDILEDTTLENPITASEPHPHNNNEETPLLLPSDDPTPSAKPTLSTGTMFRLTSMWLGYETYWFLITIIIAPAQVAIIAGDARKGSALSVVSIVSSILNLFLAVLVGALNDRYTSPYGRRKPWIVAGILCMCLALGTLWETDPLWLYTIGFAFLTTSTVLASVPFNGLVADITPHDQKARVSAIMGAMNLFGYLLGALIGITADTVGTVGLYAFMIVWITTTTAVTMVSIEEPRSNFNPEGHKFDHIEWGPLLRDMVSPLVHHHDFRMVYISRFLFQLAIATIQQFLQ